MWGLLLIVVLGLLAGAVYLLRQRLDTAFRIEVADGEARLTQGEVDSRFVDDVGNICRLWQIDQGTIRGMRTRRGLRIRCRGQQMKAHRQALQNALDYPIE